MKYLITGGLGFVGSNLAQKVLARSDELVVFDNLQRTDCKKNKQWLQSKGSFDFIKGDIRNPTDIKNAINKHKPDVVFHLAGQVAMTTSIKDPRLDFETNALGSFNLLESVKDYSPDTMIFYSSTNKVYGDLKWVRYTETSTRYIACDFPKGFPETIPLDFNTPYGCSKGCADQYMLDFNRIYGVKTVVFRHSSIYGHRQFSTYDQGWVGWFCQKAYEVKKGIQKEPFTISGNGKQVRDLLYSDDLVSLYFRAVKNIKKIKGQIVNVGGGMENSLSLIELFELLEDELEITLKYKQLDPRVSDQKVFVSDIGKCKKLLGWKPKIDKLTGVKKMLDWTRDNG